MYNQMPPMHYQQQQQQQQPPMNQGYQQQAPAPQQQYAPNPQGTQQAANPQGTAALVQGRIVWMLGKLAEGRQKVNDKTKQPEFDQTGKPIIEYGFGLAVPKAISPQTGRSPAEDLKRVLENEARTLFATGHIPQNFSLKFKDGDTDVDPSGVPYSQREGYAGHIVLACTTRIPLKLFRYEGGNNIMVNDGFKNGDYVNVQINVKAHPAVGQGKAGIYVNPQAVQFVQAGPEIINTPSGDQVFGQQAPSYAGQALPYNGPQMPMQGQPAPQNQGYQQQAPAPQQQYAPNPQQPPMNQGYQQQAPNPHYGVLPQNLQPQQGQQQMPQQGQYQQPPMQGNGYPNQGY